MSPVFFTAEQFAALFHAVERKYEEICRKKNVKPEQAKRFRYGFDEGIDEPNSMRGTMLEHSEVREYLKSVNHNREDARTWTVAPNLKTHLYQNYNAFKKGKRDFSMPAEQVEIYLRYIGKKSLHELDRALFPDPVQGAEAPPEVRRYRIFFYSFVRYNVWEKGRLEIRKTPDGKMTALAKGMYNDDSVVYSGEVERFGSLLFMDLKKERKNGSDAENRLKIAAEVDGDVFEHMFRASLITKSSHGAYTAATEAVFVSEAHLNGNHDDVLHIRRYLMLRRNRFEVGLANRTFGIETLGAGADEKIRTSALKYFVGSYRCRCTAGGRRLDGRLRVFEDYRACFECPLDETRPDAPMNFQFLCAELSQPQDAQVFVLFKGYIANPPGKVSSDLYRAGIKDPVSTILIPVPDHDGVFEITGAFSCILKMPGKKEVVQAGEITLVRTDDSGFYRSNPGISS